MHDMAFRVVIPARLGSTRLPRKVLQVVAGKPLLQWVHQQAAAAGAQQVVVATDHEEVAAVCRGFGADVAMTSPLHPSGTDRINEVAQSRAWGPDEIVVNLQGDEPLMPPALIAQAARLLVLDSEADIATLAHPLHDAEDWVNPNVVKVVCDGLQRALYFSRAPVPWQREGGAQQAPRLPEGFSLRHIGIYAYRVAALARFAALPPAPLEQIEALEQLRALWHGMRIAVGVSDAPPPRGVDTEADLQVVAQRLGGGGP
jgi:3-deoxy-manno-octulosonate cytidylyltransferase (CMP-KDO synthetase)